MTDAVKNLIDKMMNDYLPEVCLVKEYTEPNYHSNLKPGEYCFINTSTKLAAAIFYCEYEKYYNIANEMLRKVVSLQCKEGENSGLWSYFYEEPIEKMVAPDHNFADFNAYPLLCILKEHGDKLDDKLFNSVKDACVLACEAIIRRNLTVIYTNPTVMGIYCTVVCGEMFGIEKFIEYGREKLDKFFFRIMNSGTYDEYNCPGYSMLIANIYSIMLRHIKDPDMHKKIDKLNRMVWEMLGEHYHCELEEYTGPNLRQYKNFSNENASAASGLESNTNELLSLLYQTKCPEDTLPLFTQKNKNVEFRRVVSNGYIYPYLGYAYTDTQFIRPNYTLGSFSMMDCWNQHRNVVAYIGNKDRKVCIRLITLHDFYDFASGFHTTVQEKGTALTLTNFHTDRGDTHVDLDPVVDATIKAKDLRVRYLIEANCEDIIKNIKIERMPNGCVLDIFGTKVQIAFPFFEMSGEKAYFEIGNDDKNLFVDAVLYSGEEKQINLSSLSAAAVVSYLAVGENEITEPEIKKSDETVKAVMTANGSDIEVSGPYKPMKQMPSVVLNKSLINGKNIISCI